MKPHVALAFGLIACCSLGAKETPSLEKVVANHAKQLAAGGIVAARIEGATVTYTRAGAVEPTPGVPPEKTIFEIGSISKVFTALLLAETVQEGKAKLDDSIAKFLPADLKLPPHVAAITLEQLATHTSGLPRMPSNFAPKNPADPYADYSPRALFAFLSGFQPESAPPQAAAYSNVGVGLLGHLLERIHGRSYAHLLAERISTPLGLSDTVIPLSDEQTKRFARPYSGSQPVSPWTLDALAGAGAIRSTAADLAKLLQTLMTEGDSPLQRAWKLVREPRAQLDGTPIGLAVLIEQRDGVATFRHDGGTGGFRALIQFTPAQQRGLVVLIDNDAIEPAAIAARLEPKDDAADAPARPEVEIAAVKLRDFPGIYEINAQARFTVLVGPSGALHVRLTGQPFFPLKYVGDDRFAAEGVRAEVGFFRSTDGRVNRLTLFQNGREVPAKRTADTAPAILFPSAAELVPYAGKYQLAPGVVFEVRAVGAQLLAKLTGQPEFPVFKLRDDHFVYDVVEAALTFERDAPGKVVALVLTQNGQTPRAPRIP